MNPMSMTKDDAVALAKRLVRRLPFGKLTLTARVVEEGGDAQIVFDGGTHGSHGIWLSVSSKARVLAHWEGYIEANGTKARPSVGQKVSFPSTSAGKASGFRRVGRVTKLTGTRATIAFVYGHGGASVATKAISELVFA